LTINRPVGEVFHFMTEAGNIFKWSRATEEVRQLTPDPLGVGSKYLIVSRFLGAQIPLDIEVTEFELNKRVASRAVSSSFIVHGRTLYKSEDDSTVITNESEIHPRGLWKLLQPFLPRLIAKSSAQDYERLRKALEESVPVSPTDPPKVITITEPIVTVQ
jgi:hypothetical protein